MISQAYIFGALGKAAFKQGEKWYLLDADAPDVVRDWHPFDNNYLSLSNSETTPVAANTDLEGIKQLLATETRKQEALTLALHLMDESIRDESLKAEIAELLGEYMEDAEVFRFLENRLLTTVVPDAFSPAFASNLCQSLQMQRIAAIYETLDTLSGDIHTFYSAWVKAAKNYFQDAGKADTAFHLLTAKGIAKTFVQGIADRDKNLWDQAALNASLLFQQEKLASNALLFFTNLKTDLSHDFRIEFREKAISESKEGSAKDDIEALIESYMEEYFDQKPSRKSGKPAAAKSAGARLEAVQANIEYTSNKMLESLREGNEGGARATLKALLRQQVQTSAPEHICKSLTKIAGYLLENGINTFSKTLLQYARLLNNNDPVVDTLYAEILKAEGNFKDAKEEFSRIKRIYPDNVVAQSGYAEILKAEGNLNEAKEEYLRIKTIYPDNVVVQNGYAEILKAEGNIQDAKQEYIRIKINFPDNLVAQNGYAEILKAEGNIQDAKQEYIRIIKTFPNDVVAQTSYAEILKAEGNLEKAKEEYSRIKSMFPNNVVSQNGYAEILKAEGNLKEAKEEYLRIKTNFPNDVVLQNSYAEILKAEGNFKEAKKEYLRIKKQFPNDVISQNGYAEILKVEGNIIEAKEEYKRIKEKFPDNAVAQNSFAEILKIEGNFKDAKEEYSRMKRDFPNDTVVQRGYANVLKSMGHLEEALWEYKRIIKSNPYDQIAFHAICSISLALNVPLENSPPLPNNPKTENDFYWLQFHINKHLKDAEWTEAQKLVMLGLETCNFYKFKSLFKRTRKYIQIQIREFEAAIADYNETLENEPIDHLLRTHAFAELNQPALAQNELTKCLRFEEMQLVRQTAGFLSEKYLIDSDLPKSNLSIPELTMRINFNEFALVSLAA